MAHVCNNVHVYRRDGVAVLSSKVLPGFSGDTFRQVLLYINKLIFINLPWLWKVFLDKKTNTVVGSFYPVIWRIKEASLLNTIQLTIPVFDPPYRALFDRGFFSNSLCL